MPMLLVAFDVTSRSWDRTEDIILRDAVTLMITAEPDDSQTLIFR
jgi:hypothetical protein